MTLIIIEGADGVGKSSLARAIYAHPSMRNCRLVHKGPPIASTLLEEYLLPLVPNDTRTNAYDDTFEHATVLDRWHLGELVYPEIRPNRTTLATRAEFAYLEMFLRSRGALLVHVTAEPMAVYRRRVERREPVVDTAEIAAELELFHTAVTRSNLAYQLVITSSMYPQWTPQEWADHVVKRGHTVHEHVRELAAFTTYVGPLRPAVLLLGDERGPTERRYPTAFVPLSSTSGHFLLRSLPDDLLCTGSLGIANANESDDPLALWELLGRPLVVALGQKALEGCVRSGLADATRVGAVPHPHPQHVRQSTRHQRSEYGKLIVQAAETGKDMRKWPQ